MKRRLFDSFCWGIVATLALSVAHWLCRYVFIGLHGMFEIPFLYYKVGVVVIGLCVILGSKRTMFCTVFGYFLGFWCGIWFEAEWVDENGMNHSSIWIWWACVMLAFIIMPAALRFGSFLINAVKARRIRSV